MSILEERRITATDLAPIEGSINVIAGPPGLGKSWFCGSAADVRDEDEILLIATLPREVNSVKYQEHDLDTIVIQDEEWAPDDGVFKATGFDDLIQLLRELREDETYSTIILDNGTEAGEMAWHDSLAPLGVGDPTELGKGGNSYAPYVSIKERMQTLFYELSTLTGKTGKVARPKMILVPWHVQPPKEKPGEDESADEKAAGKEYEGENLPMVRGSFRRKLYGLADTVVYADQVVHRDPKTYQEELQYVIQVISDNERHCKIPGRLPDKGSLIKRKYIENDFGRFIEVLEGDDE